MGQVTDASTDSANLSALSSSRARFVPFLGGAFLPKSAGMNAWARSSAGASTPTAVTPARTW